MFESDKYVKSDIIISKSDKSIIYLGHSIHNSKDLCAIKYFLGQDKLDRFHTDVFFRQNIEVCLKKGCDLSGGIAKEYAKKFCWIGHDLPRISEDQTNSNASFGVSSDYNQICNESPVLSLYEYSSNDSDDPYIVMELGVFSLLDYIYQCTPNKQPFKGLFKQAQSPNLNTMRLFCLNFLWIGQAFDNLGIYPLNLRPASIFAVVRQGKLIWKLINCQSFIPIRSNIAKVMKTGNVNKTIHPTFSPYYISPKLANFIISFGEVNHDASEYRSNLDHENNNNNNEDTQLPTMVFLGNTSRPLSHESSAKSISIDTISSIHDKQGEISRKNTTLYNLYKKRSQINFKPLTSLSFTLGLILCEWLSDEPVFTPYSRSGVINRIGNPYYSIILDPIIIDKMNSMKLYTLLNKLLNKHPFERLCLSRIIDEAFIHSKRNENERMTNDLFISSGARVYDDHVFMSPKKMKFFKQQSTRYFGKIFRSISSGFCINDNVVDQSRSRRNAMFSEFQFTQSYETNLHIV